MSCFVYLSSRTSYFSTFHHKNAKYTLKNLHNLNTIPITFTAPTISIRRIFLIESNLATSPNLTSLYYRNTKFTIFYVINIPRIFSFLCFLIAQFRRRLTPIWLFLNSNLINTKSHLEISRLFPSWSNWFPFQETSTQYSSCCIQDETARTKGSSNLLLSLQFYDSVCLIAWHNIFGGLPFLIARSQKWRHFYKWHGRFHYTATTLWTISLNYIYNSRYYRTYITKICLSLVVNHQFNKLSKLIPAQG